MPETTDEMIARFYEHVETTMRRPDGMPDFVYNAINKAIADLIRDGTVVFLRDNTIQQIRKN